MSGLRVLGTDAIGLQDNGALNFVAGRRRPSGPVASEPLESTRPSSGSPWLNAAFSPDCSRSLDDDGATEFHSIKPSNELAVDPSTGPRHRISWYALNQGHRP
jgi:hypothetical protein